MRGLEEACKEGERGKQLVLSENRKRDEDPVVRAVWLGFFPFQSILLQLGWPFIRTLSSCSCKGLGGQTEAPEVFENERLVC